MLSAMQVDISDVLDRLADVVEQRRAERQVRRNEQHDEQRLENAQRRGRRAVDAVVVVIARAERVLWPSARSARPATARQLSGRWARPPRAVATAAPARAPRAHGATAKLLC